MYGNPVAVTRGSPSHMGQNKKKVEFPPAGTHSRTSPLAKALMEMLLQFEFFL
jgi:hypothetical protein